MESGAGATASPPGAEGREARRARLLADAPAGYRPRLHLALLGAFAAAVVAAAALALRSPRAADGLAIPATVGVANFWEWYMHRYLEHRPRPFRMLYHAHTAIHHVVYTHDDMAVREPRELYFVLIPFPAYVGATLVLVTPYALAVGALFGRNAGLLALATWTAYIFLYELAHLLAHTAVASPFARAPFARRVRRHHQVHHNGRHMMRWNFCILLPFFDALVGTKAPRDVVGDSAP